jgi:hypothetical protein
MPRLDQPFPLARKIRDLRDSIYDLAGLRDSVAFNRVDRQ